MIQTTKKTANSNWDVPLFQAIKAFLQDLPIFLSFDFLHSRMVEGDLFGIFGRLIYFIEDAKQPGKRLVSQFVSSDFIGDIVVGGDLVEDSALAGVGGIKRAFIKLDAFAEAFDETEAIVVHGRFHHLEDVIWIGVGSASDEGGPRGDRLL